MEGGRCVPYSAIPSLDGRRKGCPVFCNAFYGWKVEGVSPTLQYRLLDGRWQGCPLFCNAISGWKGEGVSSTLHYHLWMVGGRCVPPYSGIPSLDGRLKVCQQFCNTVSGWNGEGLSSALQYRSLDGRWKVVCPPTLQYCLCMEVGRGVPYSAIPFLDGRRKGVSLYSAIPSLDGRWKVVCHRLCNTAFAWKLEGVSPTLKYLFWGKVEVVSPYSAVHVLSLHGSWCLLLSNTFTGWKGKVYHLLCNTVSGWKVCRRDTV
jgi:hypothetical protein